jgi:hypothetical protein
MLERSPAADNICPSERRFEFDGFEFIVARRIVGPNHQAARNYPDSRCLFQIVILPARAGAIFLAAYHPCVIDDPAVTSSDVSDLEVGQCSP